MISGYCPMILIINIKFDTVRMYPLGGEGFPAGYSLQAGR